MNQRYPVYSIRDVNVGFGALTIESNEATAKRNFRYALQSGMMSFAPQDFDLFQVGHFNLSSGQFEPFPVPDLVINGLDLRNMDK